MRFRTTLLIVALAVMPATAGAQIPAAQLAGPTPQQAIDSPATHIGANVTWVVRFRNVLVEIGPDGRVVTDRLLYEWRDPTGNWTGLTIVTPPSRLTKTTDAAAQRNDQLIK